MKETEHTWYHLNTVPYPTSRMKVPGGWLYRCNNTYEGSAVITFVPDPPQTYRQGWWKE